MKVVVANILRHPPLVLTGTRKQLPTLGRENLYSAVGPPHDSQPLRLALSQPIESSSRSGSLITSRQEAVD